MTLKRKTLASLCAALLALGFAAGCSKKESAATSTGANSNAGSDSGSKSGSDSGSKSGSDSGSKSGSDSGSKSGSDSGSKSGSDSGSKSMPNLGNLNECLSASSAYLQIVAAPAMMVGGASQEQIDEMKKELQDIEGKIPDELKSDMQVVGKAYGEYFEALANNGLTSDEVKKASENLEKGEVKKAQENIDAYFKKNCG